MLVEKTFDTGEVVLNYAEGPNNGPPILLIHGSLCRWEDFTHYFPQFTEKFHVYAIDTRGRGKSGRTPSKYHLRNIVRDIVTFIERVIGESTILLGHSEGGWIALWATQIKPENVSVLVILDAPISIDVLIAQVKEGSMRDGIQHIRPIVGRPTDEIMAILTKESPSKSSEAIKHDSISLSFADPKFLDLWSPERIEEYFENYHSWDFLKAVSCPIMLVQADPDMDALLSSDDVEKAIDYNPEIKHVIVEGVGHNLGMNIGEEPIDVGPILSFLNYHLF